MYTSESLKEITKNDFDKAYQKAMFSRILSRLKGEKNTLFSFDEVMKMLKVKNEVYIGLQCVRIEEIIGSEGRYNDFNKEFLPRRRNLRVRWQRVDEAHYQDIILPPIKLYRLGNAYFVRDGNHRVSVAREQGREFIDAEVTEIKTDIPITADMTRRDLVRIVVEHERQSFLEFTKLDVLCDASLLWFTESGRYDLILQHIHGHQYYMGIEQNRPIPFDYAVKDWYNVIYMPIIEEICKEKISARFPGRTEADLYLWIVLYWDELKRQYGENIQIRDAVKSYNENYGKNPILYYLKQIINIFLRRNR